MPVGMVQVWQINRRGGQATMLLLTLGDKRYKKIGIPDHLSARHPHFLRAGKTVSHVPGDFSGRTYEGWNRGW
jgi:hypothetical protein